jgi:hypothetical protein
MQRLVLGCAALLVCAVGCGSSNSPSSTCDNLANALNGLSGKYSACGQFPSIPFNKDACVQAFNGNSCTDADRQKINDFTSCLSGLPNCTLQSQSTWADALVACNDKLQGVSAGCANAAP